MNAADVHMEVSSATKGRFGLEKQEYLVKLAILTTAAILCEHFPVIYSRAVKKRKSSLRLWMIK